MQKYGQEQSSFLFEVATSERAARRTIGVARTAEPEAERWSVYVSLSLSLCVHIFVRACALMLQIELPAAEMELGRQL